MGSDAGNGFLRDHFLLSVSRIDLALDPIQLRERALAAKCRRELAIERGYVRSNLRAGSTVEDQRSPCRTLPRFRWSPNMASLQPRYSLVTDEAVTRYYRGDNEGIERLGWRRSGTLGVMTTDTCRCGAGWQDDRLHCARRSLGGADVHGAHGLECLSTRRPHSALVCSG